MDRSIALAVALLAACCALGAVDADCDEWSFKCGNGECVSVDRRCDGEAHCSDGSDEAEATCKIDAAPLSLYDRAEVTVAFNEDFVGLWVMLCGDAACSKVYVDGANQEGVLSYAAEVNCNTRGYDCSIESSGSPDDMDEFQTGEIVLVVERGPGRLSVWLKDHADHPRTVSISNAYSQLSLRPEVWLDYMPADIVVVSSLTEAPTTPAAATTQQPPTTVTEAATTVTEAATTVTEAATTVTEDATTVTEAATTTTEAATTEQPATTVTEDASTVTEAATTVTEATTTEQSLTTVTEAATTEQPATTVTEAATTVTEAASTVTEAATTTTEAATTEQPATTVTEAATTVTEAATTTTEAATTEQPATTVTEATTTGQPATTVTEAASTVTEATVSDEPSTAATAPASSTAAPWPPLPVPAACTDDMLSLMIPVAGDCNKYVICYSGRSQQMSCPSVLYFNYQLQTCDWPRNVVCSP